jgi:dihydroorotase-like cyclic amidohydrolase
MKKQTLSICRFWFSHEYHPLQPGSGQRNFHTPDLGITSLKVFTAYNGRLRLSDGEIFRVMRVARAAGMLTMVHAENGDVIEILV